MALPRLLVFGDQATNPCLPIRQLQRQAQYSPALRQFLAVTEKTLRSQRTRLGTADSRLFQQLESLSTSAEAYTQRKDVVMQGILHCIVQLGYLIRSVSRNALAKDQHTKL